ncbi:MAG: alpha/beta hydrolase [Pseudomonadota bacterium]|nr:alpha/beta hydrolase [Pseudomonadota bacterium]
MTSPFHYRYPHPASPVARFTALALRLLRRRQQMLQEVQSGRYPQRPATIPRSVHRHCQVEESLVCGRRFWTLKPAAKASAQPVLYLHGGAYTRNIIRYQWDMLAQLSRLSGATFLVPDYPLAPAADWQQIQTFVRAVWQASARHDSLTLLGDSAGAGLALRLAQELQQAGQPMPQQLILLSPWLNLQGGDPAVADIAPSDPMLEPAGTAAAAALYARGRPLTHPHISPLYGPLDGIRGLSVFAGGKDILYPDAVALRQKALAAGISLRSYEYPAMFHVWMAAGWLPEAKHARQQIARLL